MKELSREERALHWLHAWMRFYNVKFISLLRLASVKKTKEVLREQKEIYQYIKSLIESAPEVSPYGESDRKKTSESHEAHPPDKSIMSENVSEAELEELIMKYEQALNLVIIEIENGVEQNDDWEYELLSDFAKEYDKLKRS